MKNERHKMKINDIHIKMFEAGSGDCILYQQMLRPYLQMLSKEGKYINLLIIFHIDQDHINGIKALLKENGNANSLQIIQNYCLEILKVKCVEEIIPDNLEDFKMLERSNAIMKYTAEQNRAFWIDSEGTNESYVCRGFLCLR